MNPRDIAGERKEEEDLAYFIGWKHQPMKEGRKSEYPENTPDDKLKKMPHTKAWKFKPQRRHGATL